MLPRENAHKNTPPTLTELDDLGGQSGIFNFFSSSLDEAAMEPYGYSELEDPDKDIRLFELLPGFFHDDLKLRIFHAALTAPESKPQAQMMTEEELLDTLPGDWDAVMTRAGRCIFRGIGADDQLTTSWTHPDPDFDQRRLDVAPLGTETLYFEALSYVWGSSEHPEETLVDSPSQPQGFATLPISRNLAIALRHLRSENAARTLWVDAVCINQSDLAEREAQVLRMADIYSQASRVVAWLGPEADNSSEAFRALTYLGEQSEITLNGRSIRAPGVARASWRQRLHGLQHTAETMRAIDSVLRRGWWFRIWIVQEINLGSSRAVVQCGHDQLSWHRFRNAMTTLALYDRVIPDDLKSSLFMAETMMHGNPGVSPMWATITVNSWYRQATDPRDRVYGLLGLLSPRFRQRIEADYKAPATAAYVTTNVAVIEHTQRLEFLQFCDEDPDQKRCPSWALEFSAPQITRQPFGFQFASLNSACQARFRSPGELTVVGLKVATLGIIKPENRMPPLGPSGVAYEDILNRIRKAEPSDLDRATYRTGETLREAYAKTLIADTLESRFPNSDGYATEEEWLRQEGSNALFGEHAVEGAVDMDALSLGARRALDCLSGRVLVEIDEGFIGLCPDHVQQGDETPLNRNILSLLNYY
ncbi:hypothetical protein ACJ41O_001391 [Fusarium nematophilum]